LKNETLKSNNEFKRVFLSGDKRIGKYVILYFLPIERNINRYGIITKKYIGNAVKRNRIKRILREILRNKYSNLLSGYDIVILARKNIINASFKEIEEDIVKLINKL
jgi:ribonuclease P protein component